MSFHTYTYQVPPLSPNGLPTLLSTDLQKYFKRLRRLTDNKLKYYAVGEYGSKTQRPHYHAIIFNLPNTLLEYPRQVLKAWQGQHVNYEPFIRGNIDIANGCEATVRYVTNYIIKKQLYIKPGQPLVDLSTGESIIEDRQREFSHMSKGMGKGWITDAMTKHVKNELSGTVLINGSPIAIPRYYKDKMLTSTERARISKKYQYYHEEKSEEMTEEDFKNWRTEVIRKHQQQIFKQKNQIL